MNGYLLFRSLLIVVLSFCLCATNVNVHTSVDFNQQVLSWMEATSPTDFNLLSVEMISSTDGWAIGTNWILMGDNIILRWNGTDWLDVGNIITSTTPGLSVIRGDISMVSANDGWIVVGGPVGDGLEEAAFLRWNGTSWTQNMTLEKVSLVSVDMISATDGWAAGYYYGFFSGFYHWDGNSWQFVSSTSGNKFAHNDIDMVSATDGWAVGSTIMHWDGDTWNEVTCPVTNRLFSVSMVSSEDGWAVGMGGVILHWNGIAWTQVSSPVTTTLGSVKMVSTNDGWAVGSEGIILHWNGSEWSIVTSPTTNYLSSLAMVSSDDGWAVGYNGTILKYGYTDTNFKVYLPVVLK